MQIADDVDLSTLNKIRRNAQNDIALISKLKLLCKIEHTVNEKNENIE